MSLRGKIIALFTVTVAGTVGLVTVLVSASTSRTYKRMYDERSTELVNEYHHEFERRANQAEQTVSEIAGSDEALNLAIAMSRSAPDYSQFVDAWQQLHAGPLNLLELTDAQGTIISSKQWPARFGYKEDLADFTGKDSATSLHAVALPEGPILAVLAARAIRAGDKTFYVFGGIRMDRDLLQSVALPQGMHAWLANPHAASATARLTSADASVLSGDERQQMDALVDDVLKKRAPINRTIGWESDPANTTAVHAFPLTDRRQQILGVLLVSNSQEELLRLNRRIRWDAALVAGVGILLGMLMSGWLATRVTHPVEELALAADQVAAGNLGAQVDDARHDEIGRLAYAFNRMTRELLEQREQLVQSERVAAWRELAKRLAHELKNPLFPLQITVENLLRARQQQPEQFEEVFTESLQTLLAEITNLKTIIARFSDFSKMPAPEMKPLAVNDAVKKAAKVYEAQLQAHAPAPIRLQYELDATLDQPLLQADPELLHRALSNLILNALDAMREGGTLTLRTQAREKNIRIEVRDTGKGLTEEEQNRLFTPYYTTKEYGTGLGLAIVQSVVSDHQGKIWVESQPGQGTSFIIELPRHAETQDMKAAP